MDISCVIEMGSNAWTTSSSLQQLRRAAPIISRWSPTCDMRLAFGGSNMLVTSEIKNIVIAFLVLDIMLNMCGQRKS